MDPKKMDTINTGHEGGGSCNHAQMCTCATHSLPQSSTGCRVQRTVVWTLEDTEQKVIDIWHTASLTYTSVIDQQLCLKSTTRFRDCSLEINVLLWKTESILLHSLCGLKVYHEWSFQCMVWHVDTHPIIFTLQICLPDEPRSSQVEMHNRVWACLTSTNSFPK